MSSSQIVLCCCVETDRCCDVVSRPYYTHTSFLFLEHQRHLGSNCEKNISYRGDKKETEKAYTYDLMYLKLIEYFKSKKIYNSNREEVTFSCRFDSVAWGYYAQLTGDFLHTLLFYKAC